MKRAYGEDKLNERTIQPSFQDLRSEDESFQNKKLHKKLNYFVMFYIKQPLARYYLWWNV